MVVTLLESGVITNEEWATALSAAIDRAQAAGDPDHGDTYYEHWLSALEALSADKKLVESMELDERKQAWAEAYRTTPHGKPVELKNS